LEVITQSFSFLFSSIANFIIDSNILGKTERGKNLEILLHLFNKEEALKYLEAG